jgi:hypothetical protein
MVQTKWIIQPNPFPGIDRSILFKNVGRICLVTSAIKAVAVTLLVIPMTVTLIVLNCDAKNDVTQAMNAKFLTVCI